MLIYFSLISGKEDSCLDKSENKTKLRYKCCTSKKLCMQRAFLSEKGKEPSKDIISTAVENIDLSDDSDHEQSKRKKIDTVNKS